MMFDRLNKSYYNEKIKLDRQEKVCLEKFCIFSYLLMQASYSRDIKSIYLYIVCYFKNLALKANHFCLA